MYIQEHKWCGQVQSPGTTQLFLHCANFLTLFIPDTLPNYIASVIHDNRKDTQMHPSPEITETLMNNNSLAVFKPTLAFFYKREPTHIYFNFHFQ